MRPGPPSRLMLLCSAACVVSLLIVVGVGWGSAFWIRSRNDADSSAVSRLVSGSDGLSVSLVDQEQGVRGYVITGSERFLGPFHAGEAQTATITARLRGLLARDPVGMRALAQVNT